MKKFEMEISRYHNCCCDICFNTNYVLKISYYVKDYRSDKTLKICKNLQPHKRTVWICNNCARDFVKAFGKATGGNMFVGAIPVHTGEDEGDGSIRKGGAQDEIRYGLS